MADADVAPSPLAHKRPDGMRGMRGEMMEGAQNAVGFSDHYYCALKTAAEPPWNQWRAEEDVVGTGMTKVLDSIRHRNREEQGCTDLFGPLFIHTTFFIPAVLCGCGNQPTFAFFSPVEFKIKTKCTGPFTKALHGEERAEERSRDSKMTISLFLSALISPKDNLNHMLAAV